MLILSSDNLQTKNFPQSLTSAARYSSAWADRFPKGVATGASAEITAPIINLSARAFDNKIVKALPTQFTEEIDTNVTRKKAQSSDFCMFEFVKSVKKVSEATSEMIRDTPETELKARRRRII